LQWLSRSVKAFAGLFVLSERSENASLDRGLANGKPLADKNSGDAVIAWGCKGVNFLVIRCISAELEGGATIHLRIANWIDPLMRGKNVSSCGEFFLRPFSHRSRQLAVWAWRASFATVVSRAF
jgi:hypothetical protein